MQERNARTVMVVDDEPMVLSVTRQMLEMAGYRVLAAGDTETALSICRLHGEEISLALLDYLMPGMSGPELVKCLRDLQPQLRIAMMSGYTKREIEDRGVPFEEYLFLQKPFTLSQLVAFVQSAMEGTNGGAARHGGA